MANTSIALEHLARWVGKKTSERRAERLLDNNRAPSSSGLKEEGAGGPDRHMFPPASELEVWERESGMRGGFFNCWVIGY